MMSSCMKYAGSVIGVYKENCCRDLLVVGIGISLGAA